MSSLLETANKNALKIFLVAASVMIVVFIIAVNLKEPQVSSAATEPKPQQTQVVQAAVQPISVTEQPRPTVQPKKPEPTSAEYSKKVTALLKQDLKTVDAHLAIEGSTKWLFVTVGYSEWRGMGAANRKEMVNLLLRHMKQNYSDDYSYLQVSVGVNADQPLAEGKWSPLGNPEIELIGE